MKALAWPGVSLSLRVVWFSRVIPAIVAVDFDVRWGLNSNPNFVALDANDHDRNVIANSKRLTRSSGYYKHQFTFESGSGG